MEELLSQFDDLILAHKIRKYDVPGDRSTVRTELTLSNHSRLIAYESFFYDTHRQKYSYQWISSDNQHIHRWDNAHDVAGIATSPHHQHVGSDENIQPSEPMTLGKVLAFIAARLTAD
ncbi:toxin-antitoxin system TumE family protein [Spirosoma gilvum]